MLDLMLRMLVVGGLANLAAFMFERALAHLRLPIRYPWTAALLITALLPLVPELKRSPLPDILPTLNAPAIVISTVGEAESLIPANLPLLIWLTISAIVLMVYCSAYVRLVRARSKWRQARVGEHGVYVADDFGPAVLGFLHPRIVVPSWVCTATRGEQEMILLHEQEHIRARDQLQLLLIAAATVATAWNPFTWLLAKRLRFTIEADCDQRVLAKMPDAARYATLLVDVGAKQTGLLLTPALAEHRNGLERRVRMLANTMVRNRWKAAALTVGGIALAMVACEARLPDEPRAAQAARTAVTLPDTEAEPGNSAVIGVDGEAGNPDTTHLPRKVMIPDGPRFTPVSKMPELRNRDEVSAALLRNYPATLREAAIGGKALVWVEVRRNGNVGQARIIDSTGHPELDEAALSVVRIMKFVPAENKGKPVDAWVQLPISFATQ